VANFDTQLLINGANPVTVGGTGTSVKYFPAVPGASIGAASNSYGFIFVPGANRANGQRVSVLATGSFQCPAADATSPAVTIGLYAAFNLQPGQVNPSNQKTSSSLSPALSISTLASYQEPAATPGVVAVPWTLRANLNADNDSELLQGDYSIQIDNGSVQSGAITSVAGVLMSQDIPIGLLIGVTFSQSGSGNTAKMYQFGLSL